MPGLQKSHSCSSLNEQATVQANANFYKNNLTVNVIHLIQLSDRL